MKRLTFVVVLLFLLAVYLVACDSEQVVEEGGPESQCLTEVEVSEGELTVRLLESTAGLCVSGKAIPEPVPEQIGECTIFRWLGAFQVLTEAGEPPEGTSAVQWTATYTADDVEQAQALEQTLCLGILFASQIETYLIDNPDPTVSETFETEGDLSDPVVGVGSG